jgi:3,4-dihydroxyphenylacetate 2,3-dioxygenase
MNGHLLRGMLVPHTPRFLDPAHAAPVFQPVINGLKALGEEVARLRPHAIVIASSHWVTTFHHYVAGPSRLAGVLTSTEAPDLVRNVRYEYPGDPELARALVEAGSAQAVPVVMTEESSLPLDYGTVIPLRYLTPAGDVPIVPLSFCHLADLGETLRWGRAIGAAVRAGRKQVVLAVTGALSHRLVRGPERWPAPDDRVLDDRMMSLLASGDLAGLESSLGDLARDAHVESGGRHLALLVGALGAGYRGRVLGYGPSSGSGNAVITLSPN